MRSPEVGSQGQQKPPQHRRCSTEGAHHKATTFSLHVIHLGICAHLINVVFPLERPVPYVLYVKRLAGALCAAIDMTTVSGDDNLACYASAPHPHRAVEGLKCRSSSSGENCASISKHKSPSRLNCAATDAYSNHKDVLVASPTCRASVPACGASPSSPQAAILTPLSWFCW